MRGTSVLLVAFPCFPFIVDISDFSRVLSVFFFERFLNPAHNVFRRRIPAAVMSDFVNVDLRKQTPDCRLAQRIRPVFNLRVAGKEQLLSIHFKQQNQTGVVHHLVERANDAQQLFASYRTHALDEPAREWRRRQRRIGFCATKDARFRL